ncbi:MAG: lysophospholipid acyltransferase family protein [Bacteroidota bacterium]
MKKLLGYLFTPLHLLVFGGLLLVFDVIQRLANLIGGYQWQKRSVDFLNLGLYHSTILIGARSKFDKGAPLPTDRPIIFVSNHQSMYDIPPFYWNFDKHHIKFVSKIELAKGIPSISYNLRHGGNAVIDRKNPRQALPALKEFAQFIEKNNYAAVIFPEGTRSRNGVPKRFSSRGLKTLLKYAPSALVVPVSINNSWRLVQHGSFPLSFGERLTWKVHPAIDPKGRDFDELFAEIEETVISGIDYDRSQAPAKKEKQTT